MKLSHILIGAAVALVVYKAAKMRAAPAQAAKQATAGTNTGGTAGTVKGGAEWWSYAGSWQA